MRKSAFIAVSGLLALLVLAAAPAAHAQTFCRNLGINFSCSGGGGGKLNLSCRSGQSDAQCCNAFKSSVRRLCTGRLGSFRCGCNRLCNAAGECFEPGGSTSSTDTSPKNQGRVRGRIPGMLERPCPRVAFKYVCTTGRQGSAAGDCPTGHGTKACCEARLSLACGGAGLVNSSRSSCRCVGARAFRRRR